ncbi:MAG: DUF1634 domain-containing protein [Chloroflexi bacterium]|nr:DUF1634 domain-containing protein [Chloroflexota bacterium]
MNEHGDAVHDTTAELLKIELFIAQLLRIGVLISFVIVLIGIVGVIVTDQTGYHTINLNDLDSIIAYRAGHPDFPNTVGDVLSGVLGFKPYAVISLGLLVLIAIPVVRVAVSIAAFMRQRDWLYVGITVFVLVMLLLSFALGEAGG